MIDVKRMWGVFPPLPHNALWMNVLLSTEIFWERVLKHSYSKHINGNSSSLGYYVTSLHCQSSACSNTLHKYELYSTYRPC